MLKAFLSLTTILRLLVVVYSVHGLVEGLYYGW